MGGKVGKGSKRGAEEVMDRIAEKQKRAKEQAEAQKQWFNLKVNTSVYVTGLPDDITEVQLAEVRCFSCRQCVVRFVALAHCYDDQYFGSANQIATVQQPMAMRPSSPWEVAVLNLTGNAEILTVWSSEAWRGRCSSRQNLQG